MRPIHPSFQGAKLWLPSPTPDLTREVTVSTVDELRELLQSPELSEQDVAIRRFRESQRLVLDTGLVDRQGNRIYEMDWLQLEAGTDFAGPVFVRYWGPDRGFLLHRHDQTDTRPWDATLAQHATRVQNYWNGTAAFFQQFRWHPL
ncbi:hypothetical protein [Hymenobacter sp. YC55]|uniref:hypothetical protein n=1 Tax=Hymenobacter sp. YC55 TaxID=3034019 RepID=UPI0023FA00A3|nr:hypothetical protein [Hymenobacter sp. YC55]MDF7815664.1 hypothetical protein [Hymenobacter sp. YC55]